MSINIYQIIPLNINVLRNTDPSMDFIIVANLEKSASLCIQNTMTIFTLHTYRIKGDVNNVDGILKSTNVPVEYDVKLQQGKMMTGGRRPDRYGADFSEISRPVFEIHGEHAYIREPW